MTGENRWEGKWFELQFNRLSRIKKKFKNGAILCIYALYCTKYKLEILRISV